MMHDANTIGRNTTLDADVCIIGGGAAGITIALRLLQSGLNLVLLESGGHAYDRTTQALCWGETSDPHLHSPPDRYRLRRFGGATVIWGGRCVPFDPIDLCSRPWIPDSTWPIAYDTLAPYYPDANAICEAGEFE